MRLLPPCYYPTNPAVMEYAGFKKGFTNHDWCEKHYEGEVLANDDIVPCDCPCHGRNVQGVLFGASGVDQAR